MNKIIKKIEEDSFLINKNSLDLMKKDLEKLGINNGTLFYELYTTYFSFAVGNGGELFSLEQLEKYNNSDLQSIIFASDDGGTLVYNKESGAVFEYSGIYFSNENLPDLKDWEQKWESFELFLIDYYNDYL